MPPTGADLVRAKITRMLNESTEVSIRLRPAIDKGECIIYNAPGLPGRKYKITVELLDDP